MSYSDTTLSIVIPTYKRPDALRRALESVGHERASGLTLEIVIADNDPAGTARRTVTDFEKTCDSDIIYIHVPEPGVSNARNGALSVATGRYILFLDDDMEARAPWAQSMMDAAKQFDAALVFGPVKAVMPETDNPFFDYMQPLFSRDIEKDDGLIRKGIGSGNCLMDRAKLDLPSPVFNPGLNKTGGEDDHLFRQLEQQDIRIAWTNAAVTLEHVPTHRATLRYVLRRNFAFGQAPTQESADLGWRGVPGIVKWMGVGCAQIVIYGALLISSKLRRKPEAIHHWGRLAQAVGKVVWSERLSPKFYGI